MGRGDLVVWLEDPLLYGGELLIVGCVDDGRLLLEQVHYDGMDDADGAAPVRIVADPHRVETIAKWARQAA